MSPNGVLLIGFGNPGRGDDGLGPALARRIADRRLPGVSVDIDYQLTVEQALPLSRVRTVVFADAALDADGPFYFRAVPEEAPQTLGSHAVSPQAVLALARLLFGSAPRGFLLGIAGAEFGTMHDGLSATALRNLDLAEAHLLAWLQDPAQTQA